MRMKSTSSLSECDGKTRLMAQAVKDLPRDYDDLHSIPRTRVKEWGLMACSCVSALERQEAGRQTDRSLGPLSASPALLIKFQADKRVCVKQNNGRHLMNDTWDCLLMSIDSLLIQYHKHTHTHFQYSSLHATYIHKHVNKCACYACTWQRNKILFEDPTSRLFEVLVTARPDLSWRSLFWGWHRSGDTDQAMWQGSGSFHPWNPTQIWVGEHWLNTMLSCHFLLFTFTPLLSKFVSCISMWVTLC